MLGKQSQYWVDLLLEGDESAFVAKAPKVSYGTLVNFEVDPDIAYLVSPKLAEFLVAAGSDEVYVLPRGHKPDGEAITLDYLVRVWRLLSKANMPIYYLID